jgi:uncharacterized protein YuzE
MERVNITIGPLSFDHADYDADSDVLYLHVGEPQAGEGEETPEGHVVRYSPRTSRIVGITVLGARRVLERDGPFGRRARDRRDNSRATGTGTRARLARS